MFQFPAFAPLYAVLGLQPNGFPHSGICGSTRFCHSPQLFATYYALLRLREPLPPPCALILLSLVILSYIPLMSNISSLLYLLSSFTYFDLLFLFRSSSKFR